MSELASVKQWPCDASEYTKTVRIGSGSFSQVWRAKCPANDCDIAIKTMDLENISTSFEDILQEVQTMRLTEHENVLNCYCSFVVKDQLWLVMQLMDKGSCLRLLSLSKHYGIGEGMSEDCLAYVLAEVMKGLSYLHGAGAIHRDIKSGNVLLDSNGNCKLADFGVSGWTIARGERTHNVKTFVGTPCYMAPEVMEQSMAGYDNRADIWSLGIMALELAKGYAPYSHFPPMKVLILTIEEAPPSLQSYPHDRQLNVHGAPFSSSFEDFYKQCLQKNPKSRPSAAELSKHSFLRSRTSTQLLETLLCRIPVVGVDEMNTTGPNDSTSSPATDMASMEHQSSSAPRAPDATADVTVRTGRDALSTVYESSADQRATAIHAKLDKTETSGSFAPGTTWVFEETTTADHTQPSSIDEFLEEFESDAATIKAAPKPNLIVERDISSTDDFMDEFEGSLQDESLKK